MKPLPAPPRFSGIWIPLVTPFTARGAELDLPAAQRLADYYVKAGVAGLVVCGTTGEAATLSTTEQDSLLAAVLETVNGRCDVMMGAAGSDTAAMVRRIRQFDSHDLAGLLISPPAYVKPSQQGILAHYQRLAAATRHLIMLYNIPSRTGVNLEISTVAKLASSGRFPAIKESTGNIPQLINLIETGSLDVLSGDDSLLLVTLLLGGTGGVCASAHIRPDLFVALVRYVRQGRIADAQALSRQLQPLISLLFSEPNPAPVKTMLAMQGLIGDTLRLPMMPVSAVSRQLLADEWQRVSAIAQPAQVQQLAA
jgi:4-hydroxy-tetrahydrodipicolinate synthase